MHSFDICDFPADFLAHLYNFAADEFGSSEPVENLNPSEPILFPEEHEEVLQAKPQDLHPGLFLSRHLLESDPLTLCNDPTRSETRQSFERFPILSETWSHIPDRASQGESISPSRSSPGPGVSSASKAVPIAPLQTCDALANEGIEAAISEEASRAKELELRALRAYHRKIRNRESAARSNLARKRRRELERMELSKKQRIFQGELTPAVS